MKKSIRVFIQKVEEQPDGVLSGGFSSIKGGFASFATITTTTNNKCNNTGDCSNTDNSASCTNTTNCDGSTNDGSGCSNRGGCVAV